MPLLSPRARKILRWIAFGPVVAVVWHAFFGAALFLGAAGWITWWSVLPAVPSAVAVYLGAVIAPARRRVGILLAAGITAACFAAWAVFADGFLTFGAALGLAAGIALGAAIAWRRARLAPRRAVLAVEVRNLRYKGTAPFQDLALDRKSFFGRDRESRSLRSLVLAERLVVLFAKSGMGKTSLINAGLAEPLRERGYLPMVVRLADRERGPVGSLLDAVRAAAQTAGVDVAGGDDTSAWRFFKTAEFWSQRDDLLRPVLIVDQFEELFTLHEPGPRREFIRQLAELVRGRAAAGRAPVGRGAAEPDGGAALGGGPPDLKIVLSLREDFLADLEELAADIPGILHRRFRLGPLSAEGAKEAIVGPARLADEDFDSVPFSYRDEAVERIIAFLTKRRRGTETVETDEVEPANLQLVCQYLEELVQSRQLSGETAAGVEISEADLGDETQLRRVLESFYDRTVAAIRSPRERWRVQRLCERVLISGSGRRATEDEDEIHGKHKVSKARLQALVNARLLRPEPRLGGVFYELSHDTLVEPIRQSRRKRGMRRVRLWGGIAALILLPLAAYWLATKEAKAFLAAIEPLPEQRDALRPLVEARLEQIEARHHRWALDETRFIQLYLVVDEARRSVPSLRGRADRLRRMLLHQILKRRKPAPLGSGEPLRRVLIPGGEFTMGSSPRAGRENESPPHRVVVSPFYLQEHEVTNGEYARFDSDHEFEAGMERYPVVNVTWKEAIIYAAWLGGNLPTEAQWEFAARAGCPEPSGWCRRSPDGEIVPAELDELAWTSESSGLQPVRGKSANHHGVYDLYGNVSEWCRDRFGKYGSASRQDPVGPGEGRFRVVRGGSFASVRTTHRGAFRDVGDPDARLGTVGFRVAWSTAGEY